MSADKASRSDSMSRGGRVIALILGTGVNAVYVLALQVLALVTLQPSDYGAYSIQYLGFALAASIGTSLVSESWLRRDLYEGVRESWANYSAVLGYLSLAAGLVVLAGSLLVPALASSSWVGAIAVAASTYRVGARYHAVRLHQHKYVFAADVVGLSVTIGTWMAVFVVSTHSLQSMVMVWASGAAASALLSRWPSIQRPRVIRNWVREHKDHVKPLLRDSLLQDAGAVGTPFLLAPVLGLASFGTYRAVSNVSAPVRLVLTPLRPTLASVPLSAHRSFSRIALIVCGAAFFGIAAYLCLSWIGESQFELGTLNELAPFSLPTAVYVAANFLGHYYYVPARAHSSGQALMTGRIFQTVIVIIFPIVGVIIAGLSGAIWAYALATVLWAVGWMAIVLRSQGLKSSASK